MKLDNFPLILWINLERSIDRRKDMIKELESRNLRHHRIRAVDGYNIEQLKQECNINPIQTPAVNACLCSHLKALKFFIKETEEEEVVIFEDDIDFIFQNIIPFDWSEFYQSLPQNWNLIQLSVTYIYGSIKHTLTPVNPKMRYDCAAAYLINRKTAIDLLNLYKSNTSSDDGPLFDFLNKKFITADSMITSVPNAYSIPLFTYQTKDSTIHPNHLIWHSRSKQQQLLRWESIAYNWKVWKYIFFNDVN